MSNSEFTSKEWCENLDIDIKTIVDPDGWDRANLEWSFYKEKIGFNEFYRRLLKSTRKLR